MSISFTMILNGIVILLTGLVVVPKNADRIYIQYFVTKSLKKQDNPAKTFSVATVVVPKLLFSQ